MGRLKTTTKLRTRVGLKNRQVIYAASGISLALLIAAGIYLYLNLKSEESRADESGYLFTYSFGHGEGRIESGSSEDFLPEPQSGKARVYVAGENGYIAAENEGEEDLGTGSELKLVPSQSYRAVNKFSVYEYDPGNSFYTKFSLKISGYFGVYYFLQGKGSSFSNDREYDDKETFAGLKFTNIMGYVVVSHLKNKQWDIIDNFSLEAGKVYEFELYGNNEKGKISYQRADSDACSNESVSKGKFDLWVNNEKVGDDLQSGKFSNKSAIDSWMFYGNGDFTNTAALYLDDIVYGNQILPGIAPVENQPENLTFSDIGQNSFRASFDQAAGMPDGYIAIRKEGSIPIKGPVDYTEYAVGETIDDGTVAYIGPDASFEQSDLNPGTTYFYRVYSYQGAGECKNYHLLSPLEGSQSTVYDPDFALFRSAGNGSWSNADIWEKETQPGHFEKAETPPGLTHKPLIKTGHTVYAENLTVSYLKIETGGELVVENDLIINDGAASIDFSNSGRLTVHGALTINGAIESMHGSTIAFHGGAQIIPAGTYHNVVIDGGSEKQLSGAIEVAGELLVNDGLLNTGEDTVFLIGGRIAESASGYISGAVAVDTTVDNAAIEVAGLGLTIDAAENNQNLGAVKVVRISGDVSALEETESIKKVWRIEPEFQPDNEVSVTFAWSETDQHENLNIAKMQVWKSEDKGLSWQQVGEAADGSARTLTVSTTTFSDWTVGNASGALPVTFIEFKAEQRNPQTILKWSTAVEVNNLGFEVQRSFDAKNFEKIGFVSGNGTTDKVMRYEFTTNSTLQSAYYRLRQVDIDGRYDFSDIISVDAAANRNTGMIQEKMFSVYPNPISDKATVSATASFDRFESIVLSVYNMQGRQVVNEKGTLDEINDRLSYRIQSLNKGQYILHIAYGSHIEKINIIKR